MNYHWDFKPLPPSQIIDTLRQIGFKPPFDTLLALRGISTRDEAYHFLNPSLQLLHNPFLMKGMQQAIDRIQKAIAAQERILQLFSGWQDLYRFGDLRVSRGS